MLDLGVVRPGSTLYIPFATFAGSTGAPITLTGLATSDVLIYKDGGTTQRASSAGITLLDTDGIDFDSLTGVHGLSIDLADNTTSGFYTAGSRYFVVISDVTVDSQTLRFVAATFRIGYAGAIHDTTIATLSSQTSFTLAAGSADDNAYVGCPVVIHDAASAVQVAVGYVSAYTGSTRTVTLAADPAIFTMAAGDNVAILAPSNVRAYAGTLQTAAPPTAAQVADALLGRNVAGGSDGGRTVAQALYALRNRVAISGGTMTVYATDDSTSSWTAAVTTAAGNPVTELDPA